MNKGIFSERQAEQIKFVIDEVRTCGYGLSLGWMNQNIIGDLREEFANEFCPNVSFRQFNYEDALLLPPKTSLIIMTLGKIASDNNLKPSYIGIITQVPGQTGVGHFDNNATMSLVLPLSLSDVQMQRPGIDGIPLLNDDGTHKMYDSHGLLVPAGSLIGFGGPKTKELATFHRVSNPTVDERYSIGIACK